MVAPSNLRLSLPTTYRSPVSAVGHGYPGYALFEWLFPARTEETKERRKRELEVKDNILKKRKKKGEELLKGGRREGRKRRPFIFEPELVPFGPFLISQSAIFGMGV